MKKIIFTVAALMFLFSTAQSATALTSSPATSGYEIKSFKSQIDVNSDTSLTVTETILANYLVQKHGIIRVIPVVYSSNDRTINADFKIISVTDENNKPYKYSISTYNQSKKIQIGDPNQTITGNHNYLIKYNIKGVLLRYDDHDEVYWNVVGREWDTQIQKASAEITSNFAPIIKVACFEGAVGSQQSCQIVRQGETLTSLSANSPLGPGKDLTIVIGLDKENQLQFPGLTKQVQNALRNNIGYLFALCPLSVLLLAWLKKGRDLRFLSDNVYTIPENQKSRVVSLFEREHLPLVYSPINGLTPSQVGTIIDERVDTKDVVAEIVELGRLGYLTITKTEKKKLLGKGVEYTFRKKQKDQTMLKGFQIYLLDKIFETGDEVKLSDLKNNFYQSLQSFKSKLYEAPRAEPVVSSQLHSKL